MEKPSAAQLLPLLAASLAGTSATHGTAPPKEVAKRAMDIARASAEELGWTLDDIEAPPPSLKRG